MISADHVNNGVLFTGRFCARLELKGCLVDTADNREDATVVKLSAWGELVKKVVSNGRIPVFSRENPLEIVVINDEDIPDSVLNDCIRLDFVRLSVADGMTDFVCKDCITLELVYIILDVMYFVCSDGKKLDFAKLKTV